MPSCCRAGLTSAINAIAVCALAFPSAALGQLSSSWESIINDDGSCLTVASPTKRDERIAGDHPPRVHVLSARDHPDQFMVEIAGPVEQSQIFVEIDGVVYPTGTLEGGTHAVLIVRAPDAAGNIIVNEPTAYYLANKAIVLAMSRGQTLTAHVVVRDGPKVGTVYDEVYSLEGFTEAKAASDAACS